MKKYTFILLFSLSFCHLTMAQRTRICANQMHDSLASIKDPQFAFKRALYEQALNNQMAISKNFRVIDEVVRIPVVVHVVHNQTNGAIVKNNIPNEQIYSQIKVLNEDYRKKIGTMGYNTNPNGADTQIEFFLANIDPDGKPSSGITRHYSSKASFDVTNDNDRQTLSKLGYWDSNKYLNIWVTSLSLGFIGYGEFPYAETIDGLDSESSENLDGVFIDYTTFGKKSGVNTSGLYSFGRTVTHEIGHWLGLYHTWGYTYCGTDYVTDTPPTAKENLDFCKPVYSNCNGTRSLNMIENYMDYTPDSCMNVFTYGQKERMRAALDLSKRRKRMLNYAKYQLPASSSLQLNFQNPMSRDAIEFQVLLPDFQDFSIEIYNLLGQKIYTAAYKDLPSTVIVINKNEIPPGLYIVSATSNLQNIRKKVVFL